MFLLTATADEYHWSSLSVSIPPTLPRREILMIVAWFCLISLSFLHHILHIPMMLLFTSPFTSSREYSPSGAHVFLVMYCDGISPKRTCEILSSNQGENKGENQMKVTCGFSEREEFWERSPFLRSWNPFEREKLEKKTELYFFYIVWKYG